MSEADSKTVNFDDLSAFRRPGPRDETIYRQGDRATEVFFVLEGTIELRGGASAASTVVGPGEFFGEQALGPGSVRNLSAVSRTEFLLLCLDRDSLRHVFSENPEIALRMLSKQASTIQRLRSGPATPAIEDASAWLVHPDSGSEFELDPNGETSIGRKARGSESAPDLDLSQVDEQRSMSRNHARIVGRSDGYYLVHEKRARNGTRLNGSLLGEDQSPVKLQDGDILRLGAVSLRFRQGESR